MQEKMHSIKSMIEKANPNNLRTLVLQGNFIDLVLNNSEEAKKIEEKLATIKHTLQANKNYANIKRLQYYENISPSVVVASGDYSTLGLIKSYNPEVLKTLEMSKEQLIDQNVKMLMPKMFADYHDQ